jgi:hypothetical protein
MQDVKGGSGGRKRAKEGRKEGSGGRKKEGQYCRKGRTK